MEHGLLQHSRSSIVTAYALCGFAHIASMAIFVGGVAALRTFQKKRYTAMGLRALVAATLACLMTACIAEYSFLKNPSCSERTYYPFRSHIIF